MAELEPALNGISVVGPPPPSGSANPGHYFPLHFIATDATGASLVVEFVGGEMNVYPPSYDNGATSDGVLTNAPAYDWQRTNLANYQHLSVVGSATTLSSNGGPPVGSGLMGLPGDPTSASRFVRAATLRQGLDRLPSDGKGWLPAPGGTGTGYADPVRTVVNVAMQLVQMIQATPYGTTLQLESEAELKQGGSPVVQVGDWTMWWLVRDNTNRRLYFASAFNGIMRSVDVSPDRFAGDLPGFPNLRSIPLMPEPASVPWFHEAHWEGQPQREMQPA